ncbi:transposase [Paucibacter sp. KBW04]|uniref:REP-associated tyrosine transposase n=1 Tax=Paucibacter sp. KBW04 TaxID=2153361 RepID=UPI000F589A23|nr:transposase [Paucibacter sp. KBW04]RQO57247.1 transposase [Paucibacter sp. KBW04]
MKYRRSDTPGATYFLTLNAADRRGQVLLDHVDCLRHSFRQVRARHPFVLDAVVVLPEHLHMLMTLPREDADFATRVMLIKQGFSRLVPKGECVNESRARRGERGLWQRRYWEHLIRDEADFARHVEYIHFNPVKHGWVERPGDWPYSSIHLFVSRGLLDANWATALGSTADGSFGE